MEMRFLTLYSQLTAGPGARSPGCAWASMGRRTLQLDGAARLFLPRWGCSDLVGGGLLLSRDF